MNDSDKILHRNPVLCKKIAQKSAIRAGLRKGRVTKIIRNGTICLFSQAFHDILKDINFEFSVWTKKTGQPSSHKRKAPAIKSLISQNLLKNNKRTIFQLFLLTTTSRSFVLTLILSQSCLPLTNTSKISLTRVSRRFMYLVSHFLKDTAKLWNNPQIQRHVTTIFPFGLFFLIYVKDSKENLRRDI